MYIGNKKFITGENIMKKHVLPALTVLVVLAGDILSKELAMKHLANYNRIDFLGGFIRFDLTFNRGGVFGIMQGYKNFFLVVSILVLVLMIAYYFYEKAMPRLFNFAMAMIIGGAMGNILDRLITDRVGVVDFVSVGVDGVYRWPTFNVADISIVIGAFLLVVVVYIEEKKRVESPED